MSGPPSGPPAGGPPSVPPPGQYGAPHPAGQYGQPAPGQYGQYPYAQPQQGNGLAVAGLVCGIIGVVLAFIPILDFVGFVLAALAIIFGGIGLSRANRLPAHPGKGMAVAGIVLGVVAVVIDVLFIVLIYAAVTSFHTSVNTIGS